MKKSPWTKSKIMQAVARAIDKKESFKLDVPLKGTGYHFKLSLKVEEPEFFIDDNGQKWIKSLEK